LSCAEERRPAICKRVLPYSMFIGLEGRCRVGPEALVSTSRRLTAIIEREGDGYVALCPEIDVASQGDTIEAARNNLRDAIELFFETADASEIEARFSGEIFVTHVDVTVA
jgi:predicted RNase H-like HicB family nuclease